MRRLLGLLLLFPLLLGANFTVRDGILAEDFTTLSDWTGAGTGTHAIDTVIFKTGNSSLQVTCPASGARNESKTVGPWNICAAGHQSVWIYIPATNTTGGTNGFNQLKVELASDSAFSHSFNFTYNASTTTFVAGWNQLSMDIASMTQTGTPDCAAIIRYRLQMQANGLGEAVYYADTLSYGQRTRAKVMLFFDDNHATVFSEGYVQALARGLKGTIAFQGNQLDTGTSMTSANIATLKAAGWNFLNHTQTHAVLTNASRATIDAELDPVAALMRTLGIDKFLNGLVYPTGATSNATDDYVTSKGYAYARGGRSQFTHSQQHTYRGIDKPGRLISKDIGNNGITLAAAKGFVDDAIRLGSVHIPFFHKFGTADSLTWTTSDYRAYLDYLVLKQRQGLIDVINWEDFILGLGTTARAAR